MIEEHLHRDGMPRSLTDVEVCGALGGIVARRLSCEWMGSPGRYPRSDSVAPALLGPTGKQRILRPVADGRALICRHGVNSIVRAAALPERYVIRVLAWDMAFGIEPRLRGPGSSSAVVAGQIAGLARHLARQIDHWQEWGVPDVWVQSWSTAVSEADNFHRAYGWYPLCFRRAADDRGWTNRMTAEQLRLPLALFLRVLRSEVEMPPSSYCLALHVCIPRVR